MTPTAPSLPAPFVREETLQAALRWQTWIGLLPLTVAWLSLVAALSTDWSLNAQYSYGWFVPLLAVAVLWQRWRALPAPQPSQSIIWMSALAGAILFLALPVRLIEEANPEWRMILWVHALLVVGLAMTYAHYSGGWPWTKHFAFAVFFPLVGVPMPMALEQKVIQTLTSFVTLITSYIIDFVGIPAFRRGNVIEISSGFVGVEDACSGIRSLQSSVFFALFLGEFYRLHWKWRSFLVLLAAIAALATNVARTYAMVHVAANYGMDVMNRSHGMIANLALILTVSTIFVIARLFRSRCALKACFPSSILRRVARSVPVSAAVAALAWLLFVSGTVEWWYRSNEHELPANHRWSVIAPLPAEDFAPIPIHERTRAILRYSSAHAMSWRDDQNHEWVAYYLRWERGRNSVQLAHAHTPEICLTGAGGQLRTRIGRQMITVGSLRLPFEQYVFDFGDRPVHVFYCLWEDYMPELGNFAQDTTPLSRLQAAFAGRRHLGQIVLEVAVHGPLSPDDARAALALQLHRIILQ